jgi:hypothetical protein
MTTEILYSPLAEVRWAHLVEPRQQMDPEKPLAWSVDLLLPLGEATSQAFLEKLERQFIEAHGSKKRRSDKGEPWKLDKEQPSQLMVVKFKCLMEPLCSMPARYLKLVTAAAMQAWPTSSPPAMR